jgi:disulfide bond formation protein DsbB
MKNRILMLAVLLVTALILAACGGGTPEPTPIPPSPTPSGDPEAGEVAFQGTCSSCHGPDATGIEGLGKNLRTSTWVTEQTDEELVQFVLTGRPASDPLNTTGVDMPPKGGNPALTEDNINDIVAYLRSIHE